MHLDIGLSLLSELEQLRKNFWQSHRDHVNKQDKPPGSLEPTHPQGQTSDSNNGPSHLPQVTDQHRTAKSHSGPPCRQDGRGTSSESNRTDKEHTNETRCRSDKNETSQQANISHQPQKELAQALRSPSTRLRKTCSALWDRRSEDGSSL